MPSATQASLTASRVAKLSLPSITRSWPASSSLRIVRVDPLLDRRGFDEAVEPLHELQRELGLRIAGVALAEQRLAMEVGELDHIVVDDRQLADARAGERRDDRAADAAGADHRDPRCLELALPDAADLRQHDVPRIAFELFVGEAHRPVEPKPPAPRLVSLSSSTSRKAALSTGAGTSCAMRSPRRTSNGSLPRLARITFTSPR